ncbi:hypothetical protein niasHT_015682 [Heterodera trifolii]|uniref:Beta-Casp domain-containing protein n=1 Tax=Heterodera trifolii TaxID=157864 RepID=A0ABD2L6J9_9BILA
MASVTDRFLMNWKGIPLVFGLVTSTTFHLFNNRWLRNRFNANAFESKGTKIAEQMLQQRRHNELMLHFKMASYGAPVALGTLAAGGILSSLPKILRFPNSIGFTVCGFGLSIGAFIVGALLLDGPISATMPTEVKSLSWAATRPCLLVTFQNMRILLDCAVGMDSMASFLPCPVVRSNRISWQKKVHPYGKGVIPILKQLQEFVYAELLPEVRTVLSRDLDLSAVDAILVSNTASLVALPFYTEGTGFTGTVYATDPTYQLGKLVMEDLCDMFERVDRPAEDVSWAWKTLCRSFPNAPLSDPNEWRTFYTRETMEKSLARIRRVFFREEIVVNGELRVSAFSSGYAIGSSNWLLQTEHHRLGYLAPSSLRHSHTKPMELTAFGQLDSLLITSLSTADQTPDLTVYKFSSAVIETLKMGGNVLIPVTPTGLVYDMFECVLKTIELQNVSRNIPIYFVSTVAESSLQFAQIFPEWLSEDKSSRVYKPEEPFFHSELARTGRIRVYDSLHGPFSRECRQPCVVFAGHPSLRIGEIVQLLDLWGGMSRNAIIMIDPDYPLETYYAPYKSLAIRAYYYPIETRLDGTQVLNKIIGECGPKQVLFPEEYASAFSTLQALPMRAMSFRQNESVSLDSAKGLADGAKRKRIRFQTELLMGLNVSGDLQGLCPINGLLSAYDNTLELRPIEQRPQKRKEREIADKSEEDPTTKPPPAKVAAVQRFSGRINAKKVADELKRKKFNVEWLTDEEICIRDYSARIRILANGTRTFISCSDPANRREIQAAIQASCLARFDVGTQQTVHSADQITK